MKRITILALLAFLTANCSQTKSQSSESNKPAIQIVTNSNGGSQPTEPTRSEVDTVKEWSGKVGSNYFHWDGKDLTIKFSKGKNMTIFSEFAKSDYRVQRKLENTKNCFTSYYYRPLAIVGNLVSFQDESGFLCGAINTYSGTYSTIELAKDRNFLFYRPVAGDPKSTYEGGVYLSDMFSENDIFKGMLANEKISNNISKLISQGKIDRQPGNLADLRKLFERFKYDFLNGEFYLDSDSLEDFAIHHIEDDKVSVWVSLTPSSRSSQLVHLELLLPIPEKIRQSLRLADSREEGFLMKDAKDLVGTSHAKFEFGGKDE
jgi:hypothetical protein